MLRALFGATSRDAVANAREFTSSALNSARTAAKPSLPSSLKTLSKEHALFKTYKPVTPGLRHLRRPISEHLYTGPPVRLLTIAKRKTGGRNNHGHITVRHIGGGHKRRLRTVDFMRASPGPQDVVRIEFDPGRSAHIALLKHRNPNAKSPWSYVLATENMRAGLAENRKYTTVVESYRNGVPDGLVPGYFDPLWMGRSRAAQARLETSSPTTAPNYSTSSSSSSSSSSQMQRRVLENPDIEDDSAALTIGILRATIIKDGNVIPLRLVPPGTTIHAVSLSPQGKAILVRSAGSFGTVISHDAELNPSNGQPKYVQVKLQSGEIRHVLGTCCATIGRVSNPNWKDRSLGKAGRSRNLGIRPSVRGMAMNAVDHPHGGGRGKSKGNKHPRSIWGWKTKGPRTRRPGPKGNKLVVKQRPRGKEKRAR